MSTIKPSQIFTVLTAAKKIKEAGGKYVPCFSGDSGIGKSEIHQAWARQQGPDFGFIDIRLAYMEGPDMVGMPSAVEVVVNGKKTLTTMHALPDFLPKDGSGLLMFEEPNRAHESVMQTMMQILTDYRIHNWILPQGWIISMAINPEGQYNVNTLDPAMKNRLSIFDVKFNQNEFVEFTKEAGFNKQLIAFLESGLWQYKTVQEVGEGIYIASRSWSKVNDLMNIVTPEGPLFFEMVTSVLGPAVAADYHKFLNEIRPILLEDFLRDEKDAFARLTKVVSSPNYTGDLTSSTVNSLIDAYKEKKCENSLILKVAAIIEQDQALNLVQSTLADVTPEELKESMKKDKGFWDKYKRRQQGRKVA